MERRILYGLLAAVIVVIVVVVFIITNLGPALPAHEDEVLAQVRDEFPQSGKRLGIYYDPFKIGAGEQKKAHIGLKNDLSEAHQFSFDGTCFTTFGEIKGNVADITLEPWQTAVLGPHESTIIKTSIRAAQNAVATTYACTLSINGGDYASENMLVVVD